MTGAVKSSAPTEAIITGAVVSPGHDGAAEAVVEVRYPNGAVRTLSFTSDALGNVLDHLRFTSLAELIGHPWTVLVGSSPVTMPDPRPGPTPGPQNLA